MKHPVRNTGIPERARIPKPVPVPRNPRKGWADESRKLAAHGDDSLLWPDVANSGDATWQW